MTVGYFDGIEHLVGFILEWPEMIINKPFSTMMGSVDIFSYYQVQPTEKNLSSPRKGQEYAPVY